MRTSHVSFLVFVFICTFFVYFVCLFIQKHVSHWAQLCYCFDAPANSGKLSVVAAARNEFVLWAVYQISTINAN